MDKSTQTEWTWSPPEGYRTLTNHELPLDPVIHEPSTDDAGERIIDSSQDLLKKEVQSVSSPVATSDHSLTQSMDQLMEHLNITDDDSNDEEDRSDDDDDDRTGNEVSSQSPYMLPQTGLPWPKLLQYLRESEAASSRYFSIPRAATMQQSKNTKDKKDGNIGSEETNEDTCQFCGRQLHKIAIEENEEPTFCCNDNKEFCVLKAVYTKKMMDDKLKRKPGKIAIKNNKVKFEKTAVERALERIRRKQKYEENERARQRMLENSKYDHSSTHRTRMIHFSLSSPAEKWIEKANPPNTKKTRLLTPLHSSHLAFLSDEVLEAISNNQQPQAIGNTKKPSLQIEKSTTGKILMVQLTDGTGQYYYSGSGNMAMICSPLFPSVLCYYLFDDNKKGNIIGYFDELGRGWLNRSDQSIRFLCSFNEIFIFDHHGGNRRVKRFLLSDKATVNETLPMIFKINRYLSVKYNSHNDVLISLISEQQHYKFRIRKKTGNTGLPQIDKKTTYHNMQLEKIKLRFMSHLDCFEKVAKQMKSTPLPAIVNTRMSNQKPATQKDVKLNN